MKFKEITLLRIVRDVTGDIVCIIDGDEVGSPEDVFWYPSEKLMKAIEKELEKLEKNKEREDLALTIQKSLEIFKKFKDHAKLMEEME